MGHLIINADDYGFDRNRTEAIRECFRRGVITQTTAMVNMPYCEQAISDAKDDGFVNAIGLHLNLTFGRPLTALIRNCPRFCDETGNFTGLFHHKVMSRFYLTRDEELAVAEEIRAQVERYVGMGLKLLHLDSHHHSHTDPSVLKFVLQAAKEYNFKSVRISRNLPKPSGLLKNACKIYINHAVNRIFAHADFFGPADEFSKACTSIPKNSTVELMVHPLYSKGREMVLNREYYDTDGVLCDTKLPIDTLASELESVCGSDWEKCSYRAIQ